MLIPSTVDATNLPLTSLSRGMNANSQHVVQQFGECLKSIKRDEC